MQQLIVDRDLEFVGAADHSSNVKGNFSFENQVVVYDDFVGVTVDTTNDWNSGGEAGGAASVTVPHCLTITTLTNDDDEWAVASGVEWYPMYNACMEVRARNDDVTHLAFNIGFADAIVYTGKIATTLSLAAYTTNATNGAMFVFDPDATTKTIRAISVNAGTDGTGFTTSHTEANASFATYRIELRDNGTTVDALYYFNSSGKEIDPIADIVGFQADAVARTTALCAYIGAANRAEDAANTLDVDYIKLWQDRY